MTPAARLSAAIGVLDRWLAGTPAEQALTNWGRASRFAGSGDRAAVRDLVFDAIRCRRSHAHLGGADTGRGLVLGGLRAQGVDPATLFTGEGHAAPPLGPADAANPEPAAECVALDCPDWLAPDLRGSLGDGFAPVMQALRSRAPVFLRVNAGKTDRVRAMAALAAEGIATRPHRLAETALEVTGGARKITASRCFAQGLVEVQDAASQAVVAGLPVAPGDRVLDFCAGGGGKALALAASGARVVAHDIDAGRMRDLPARAGRAGVRIALAASGRVGGTFDLVVADVPCSGSGAWRRAPEGKWALTPDRLAALLATQAGILDVAQRRVRQGGHLGYLTCSLLDAENRQQAAAFAARHAGFRLIHTRTFTPLDGGDGFYLALFQREQ